MAINKKLIHFKTKAAFESQLNNILDTSIVFIQDANLIWTHGTYYCLPSDEVVISNGIEPDKDQDLWIDTSDNTTVTFVKEAPIDGNMYVRKGGTWVVTPNEVYVGEEEPTNGEIIWINSNTDVMKYFNGIQWVTVAGKALPEETLIINLASNQTNPDSNLDGVIVNVRYSDVDHKQAWRGEALSFKIPDETEYTIEYSDITDSKGNKIYETPVTETYTAVGNKTRTLSKYYNCCKLTVTRTNNQSASMGSTSATITYSSYSQTVNFTSSTNSVTITIPYNVSYTIAFNGTITNYRTPANITGTSNSTTIIETGSYDSEKLTVNVSGVSSGFTVTVNGQSQTATSGTYYIPYNTKYTISASSVKGYTKKISESSITASQQTRTVTVTYATITNGVYICDNTGNLTTIEDWNRSNSSSAIGVAVISDNCSFVIDKVGTSSLYTWGKPGTTVSGIETTTTNSTAKTDYAGESNTTKIINQLGSGNAPAADYCRSSSCVVNGTTLYGYLGALGEWQTAYNNKVNVERALNKIGGTRMDTNNYYWTSTQHSSYGAWPLKWYNGNSNYGGKSNNDYVRVFYSLP